MAYKSVALRWREGEDRNDTRSYVINKVRAIFESHVCIYLKFYEYIYMHINILQFICGIYLLRALKRL